MGERRPMILSLVERGWQAARECSLELDRHGIVVLHLIKGWIRADVACLITPRPHIRILSIPRQLFWPVVWLAGVGLWGRGRLRAVLVDNDRAVRRLRWWPRWLKAPLVQLRAGPNGYEVWEGEIRLSREAWQRRCASR